MKHVLVIGLLALGLAGCATLNRIGPACRIVMAKSICDAVDIVSDVVKDTQDAVDAVTGEEVEEE